MSNRKISWTAALNDLRADRAPAHRDAFDWTRVASTDTMIGQNRCFRDGKFVGYTFLEDCQTQTAVFLPGLEPRTASVGTFPMNRNGEIAARAEVEAAVIAASARAA